jgi:hypothetical protein
MNNLVLRWHAAKRLVRRLEAKVMVAQAEEQAGVRRAIVKILERQLETARSSEQEARKDCMDGVRRRREVVSVRR